MYTYFNISSLKASGKTYRPMITLQALEILTIFLIADFYLVALHHKKAYRDSQMRTLSIF